jgi:SAM-dependent methyltransferase
MSETVDPERSYYTYLSSRSKLSLFLRESFVRDLARHFEGRVLDVGCGIGEFLQAYRTGIGLDRNRYVIEHCVLRGYLCCLGDAHTLPFSSNSFDGILLSNILEHTLHAELALAEAVRLLKPGGICVVTVPTKAGYARDPTHVRMFKRSDLQALGQSVGLRAKSVYEYPFRVSWPGECLYFCELRGVFAKVLAQG